MSNHEQDREQLRALQNLFENAVKGNTIDDIQPHVDEDFSYVSFTDKSFSDYAAFRKQWNITRKDMVGDGSFSTELNPSPSLFVGDIAICQGNAQNKMQNKDGKLFDFSSHWTVIFRKRGNEWKVLRVHNSLDPFANPMLRHGVKSAMTKYCLLSFLAGGLICALATYILIG